jgi:hypothetical protein
VLGINQVHQMVPTLYSQLLHLQVAAVVVAVAIQLYLVFQEDPVAVVVLVSMMVVLAVVLEIHHQLLQRKELMVVVVDK